MVRSSRFSYDSGAGNGPFGFGWSFLSVITRKTDKGLPRYQDAEESDVFILSGAEDWCLFWWSQTGNGNAEILPAAYGGRTIQHPALPPAHRGSVRAHRALDQPSDPTDSLLAFDLQGQHHDLVRQDAESRIADPADPTRIFSWLICESYDDKGNVIVYEYKPEDSDGIDSSQAHERNRTDDDARRQSLPEAHRYGNRTPYFPILRRMRRRPRLPTEWLFEVVFDYGEHDPNHTDARPSPRSDVAVRRDPFSSYRAGFEVRTYRLCQRVLMFHHFPDELGVGTDYLVRSTDFTYSYEQEPDDPRNPIFSFLLSATQSGYSARRTAPISRNRCRRSSSSTRQPIVQRRDPRGRLREPRKPARTASIRALQWVDLDGEGLSGILTEQAERLVLQAQPEPDQRQHGGWHRDNRRAIRRQSNGRASRRLPRSAAAAVPRPGGRRPARSRRASTDRRPASTNARHDEGWEPFTPFASLPGFDWNDPNLRFVDLTGDGHADILITRRRSLRWYPSLAEDGFGPAERVQQGAGRRRGRASSLPTARNPSTWRTCPATA